MARFWPISRLLVVCAGVFLAAALPARGQTPASVTDPDGAAKLLSFTGQISYLRIHSSYPWALSVGMTVKPQEVIVTGPDGWGLFQVADGSKFEVFPNSRVVFRAQIGDWRELLEVWLGKVRVQIEHFGGLPNNNKVRTPTAIISVRGTIFDVDFDEQLESTTVLDEEGSVAVEHALRPGSARILTANESVTVYKNSPVGKAAFDKGGFLQRAMHVASDTLYQAALNGKTGTASAGHVGTPVTGGTGSAADKNGNTSAAPPPPPPAPGPPH